MAGDIVFLVEGEDDHHVLLNICGRHRIGPISRVVQLKGVDQLNVVLAQQLRASGQSVLGVLLDADTDVSARWQELRHVLTSVGYTDLPAQPVEQGAIVQCPVERPDLPTFGAWIMPNNQIPGMLEDFLRQLVPADDPLLPHAEQAISSLPVQHFKDVHRPKALMHTWLAWQAEPGKPYGQAIKARYFDSSTQQGQAFTAWLKTLVKHRTAQ